MLRSRIQQWWWHQKLAILCPECKMLQPAPERLRLILGVGRSGTSWLSKVLAQTETNITFLVEPLFHVHPKLPLSREKDHTAIEYLRVIPSNHPLMQAYLMMSAKGFRRAHLSLKPRDGERTDEESAFVLIKEVHALLATEALVRAMGCPTVFVLRDPLYIVDSLFARDGLNTVGLISEQQGVQAVEFLDRFVPGDSAFVRDMFSDIARLNDRHRIIVGRVITVKLLQIMMEKLVEELPNTMSVLYEDLCDDPRRKFEEVAEFLSLTWSTHLEEILLSTTHSPSEEQRNDAHAIVRDTSQQTNRPYKFLDANDIAVCNDYLSYLKNE
jgi:hypothetical protein